MLCLERVNASIRNQVVNDGHSELSKLRSVCVHVSLMNCC